MKKQKETERHGKKQEETGRNGKNREERKDSGKNWKKLEETGEKQEERGRNRKKQEETGKKREETGRNRKKREGHLQDPQKKSPKILHHPIPQSLDRPTNRQTDQPTDGHGGDGQAEKQTNKQTRIVICRLGNYFCTFPNLLWPCPGLRTSVAVW